MSEFVKGFQTNEGIKKYDYESLGNLPDLEQYISYNQQQLTEEQKAQVRKNIGVTQGGNYVTEEIYEYIDSEVAVEKARAEQAEGNLSNRIQNIEQDYLKQADKTELQQKISLNTSAIDRLTNGISPEEIDGVNDLILYVEEHGAEVVQMRQDIADNKQSVQNLESYINETKNTMATKIELSQAIEQHDTSENSHLDIRSLIGEKVYTQPDEPMGAAPGTLWVDIDEDDDSENTELNSYAIAHVQNEEPENASIGTIWLDTDEESEFANIDATLTQSGVAADAKAVGDALASKQPIGNYVLKDEILFKIPVFNLTEMGLPVIPLDGTEVNVDVDTTSIREALNNGMVKIHLSVDTITYGIIDCIGIVTGICFGEYWSINGTVYALNTIYCYNIDLDSESIIGRIKAIPSSQEMSVSMFTSTATGILPNVAKGHANSAFTIDFESSAIGSLN